MTQIEFDEATETALRSIAAVRGESVGEVVAFVLREWLASRDEGISNQGHLGTGEIPVFGTYSGQTVEAVFNRASRRVRITSGTLSGRHFDSPSAAAGAVVAALNPGRKHPATNGLTFWRTAEGRDLKTALS